MCCLVFIIEPIIRRNVVLFMKSNTENLNMLSVFRKLLWEGERVYSDGGAGVAGRRQLQLNYELNDTEVVDGQ